ncbi:helix-turn-helix domain-containing protein [Micromonospora sp. WMMD1102]|uniref:ArsR/SmtB family transcription factor n=1 Tax=Micromonospora sp. WMMD1102 TaxID=3016105 RepID=UPI0024150AAF|nr:helix-turn-helix domain-containing protein [Micromonospora sp. WMMD1102]MDG4791583.1 helix-turn-helix domain-containing protein [Micromonospora sp. WMMD1102]
MTLEERVADLERRLAALERHRTEEPASPPEPPPAEGDFWALDGLKARLAGFGAERGGVLYTGSVRLPTNERYDWQYGLPTEALLGRADGEDGEDRGDGDWSDASDSLAALGHPVRLRLLREILGGRRTVAELTALDGLGTTGQAYHHLRQLAAAGWLHSTARGRYEVPAGRVVPLLVAVAIARA